MISVLCFPRETEAVHRDVRPFAGEDYIHVVPVKGRSGGEISSVDGAVCRGLIESCAEVRCRRRLMLNPNMVQLTVGAGPEDSEGVVPVWLLTIASVLLDDGRLRAIGQIHNEAGVIHDRFGKFCGEVEEPHRRI